METHQEDIQTPLDAARAKLEETRAKAEAYNTALQESLASHQHLVDLNKA